MNVERYGAFFGQPWPSGVCEDGHSVATPVGEPCQLCELPVADGDQGSFIIDATRQIHGSAHFVALDPTFAPVHRECMLRSVLGGIGHLRDHAYWCGQMHDPDGGMTYRDSALQVWDWGLAAE